MLEVHRHPVMTLVSLEEELVVVEIRIRVLVGYLVIEGGRAVCLDSELVLVVATHRHPSVVKQVIKSGLGKIKRLST